MKIKRYTPPIGPGRVRVQAVAVVNADGFLAASAPVARLRVGSRSFAAILLTHEQRHALSQACPAETRWRLDSRHDEALAWWFAPSCGRTGRELRPESWSNGGNAWVDAARLLCALGEDDGELTHGQAMLLDLVRQAAAGEAVRS